MDGFFLIDKPAGPTSHDVVDAMRRLLRTLSPSPGEGLKLKVGHAGTLDPFATGLLIVGVGAATKEMSRLVGLDKEYEATLMLGATSETDDPEGPIKDRPLTDLPHQEQIAAAMKKFVGDMEQIPPRYAAIKIKGQKMYELARKGRLVQAQPRKVLLDAFDLLSYQWPRLKVRVKCSSGTYIRALGRDLGEHLGTGAYVLALRRTAIGPFTIKEAAGLERMQKNPASFLMLVEQVAKRLKMAEKSGVADDLAS